MRKFPVLRVRGANNSGQTLLMFVLFIVVLFLFIGLGIDLGFSYITKAQLSKAVDAAALEGMKTLSQGTITATTVASETFAVNYGRPGRDVGAVSPSVVFSKASNGVNTLLDVKASTTINTFFIRVLPMWKTLAVSSSSEATRVKLIMTLVLDRSGSMNANSPPGSTHGGVYLPGAVTHFIDTFDDTLDEVAMVSFSSTANVDVPMSTPFKSAIATAANNLIYYGGTFSVGGLTNALALENSVDVPVDVDATKVVVFFTDGLANMIDDTLSCPPQTTWNFGGYDPPNSGAAFFSPNAPRTRQGQENASCTIGDNGTPVCCSGGSQFYSQEYNTLENFTRDNITAESKYRCIQLANQMRAANMYVYSIGLGGDPNNPVDFTFLQQVANDPNSLTYNSNEPTGEALVANDPTELDSLFQEIANRILLRLTK